MKIESFLTDIDEDLFVEELFEDSRVAKIIDEMEFVEDDSFFNETDMHRELTGIY